jgi:dipeptidyl aminopeptidase/acylaminoacyl peptidase
MRLGRGFRLGEYEIQSMLGAGGMNEEPPPISQINLQIPLALDRIVHHCLEKSQAQRFQSARDLVFDLEALTSPSGVASDIHLPPVARRSWLLPTVLALLVVVAVAAAFVWGRNRRVNVTPEFRQVTFRSGTVYRARFTHDGQSILYNAAWEGKPTELFTARYGSTESRSLAPETSLAAVSSKDQPAVFLKPTFLATGSVCRSTATLALLPIEGGTPRPIVDNVEWADWTPDGSDLAIIRSTENPVAGINVLQFSRDKVLYAPERDWLSDVRFSPDGKYLAFAQHVPSGDDGNVVIVDLAGKKIAESPDYSSVNGLAWTPDGWDYRRIHWRRSGDALIVTAREPGHKSRLYSIDISTKAIAPLLPERITGGWPSPDGRFLLGIQNGVLKILNQGGVEVRSLGNRKPADQIDKWSEDGKSILVWNGDTLPKLLRIDAATGKRYPLSEIKPPDMTGIVCVELPQSTPDGKAYVYSEYRLLTDLFVVTGLR